MAAPAPPRRLKYACSMAAAHSLLRVAPSLVHELQVLLPAHAPALRLHRPGRDRRGTEQVGACPAAAACICTGTRQWPGQRRTQHIATCPAAAARLLLELAARHNCSPTCLRWWLAPVAWPGTSRLLKHPLPLPPPAPFNPGAYVLALVAIVVQAQPIIRQLGVDLEAQQVGAKRIACWGEAGGTWLRLWRRGVARLCAAPALPYCNTSSRTL